MKRKSEKLKRANNVTPTKLNFNGEGSRKEGGDLEKEANPEMDEGKHSQAPSVSVFDCLGRKLTEKDLRHRLGSKASNGDEPEGSQPRAPPSQRQEKPQSEARSKYRNHRPLKVISIHDDEESSGSHNDKEVSKTKEQPLDDD